jgi:Cu(I)/Ag(I) efflux system membrane fusion protein
MLGIFLGYGLKSCSNGDSRHEHERMLPNTQIEFWTCSMHPQIMQPNPGKCPICGMDLIPVSSEIGEESSARQLKLTPTAMKLASIQVSPVQHKYVAAEIRMVGKIDYDETRIKYISAYVPGRIDRLYVNYTGTKVRKGDHLVELYSPELISAQEELIQAKKTNNLLSGNGGLISNKSAQNTLQAVRDKLSLWGLTDRQIKNIEEKGVVSDLLTIYSPMAGIVIHRNATEGMYLSTGTKIYTIADLSKVWVKLDAYESDLQWIRYGQEVEFETEAMPGDIFTGKIAFIDPFLNSQTRTVKVRVNVDNSAGKLKPEMFVKALVKSRLSVSGHVMDPQLTGKWISPMHPEIIKDHPGKCDVCGMPLVRAEELGYVSADKLERDAPLVVPATAPLITGKRAVVYVAQKDQEGVFEGREIVLGPRAGDYCVVVNGLSEGEWVVTNGNFKLDSDLQIKAKPSMMNPDGGVQLTAHQHGEQSHYDNDSLSQSGKNTSGIPKNFKFSIEKLLSEYFEIQQALSQDDVPTAKKSAASFSKLLNEVDMNQLKGDAHHRWMELQKNLQKSSDQIASSGDIEQLRKVFEILSGVTYEVVKKFGTTGQQPVYQYFCPMAFDNKGAYWLQNKEGVENPYFGEAMFHCGNLEETLVSEKKKN